MTLPPGLFELLVTEAIQAELERREPEFRRAARLEAVDAADRLALHLGKVLRRALEGVAEKERVERGLRLAREIVGLIAGAVPRDLVEGDAPVGDVLHGLWERRPDGRARELAQPLIPLLDTTILTNAPDEPRVGNQLLAEIESADRIDVLMAFVLRSGLRPLRRALRRHCERGRRLRVLTTTFTGSTELEALEWLAGDGAEVRVSYDTAGSRLHAKAWVFHRDSGFSTAYIGSSNLSRAALETGLEWNVRVSGARNPDVLDKMAAVFESYWLGRGDFVPFDAQEFAERRARSAADETVRLSPIEVSARPFQQRMLDQLAVARAQGHAWNLLVSATGTGKTVMAAIDYARLRREQPRARLLFVAHRMEILEQSRATFCQVLRDAAFGELWVAGRRPQRFEHVFASIQSLDAAGLEALAADHFDIVIVDEFHHAAAASYRRLLGHVRPAQLLGLTATPERADGVSVADAFFGGRIAAELRLWSAIEEQHLCPFLYFGVSDAADLRQVAWKRGRGYDVEGLTRVLTADDALARHVLAQLVEHVDDPARMRCLGFCVSVDHARFMARVFEAAGVRAAALWGESAAAEREQRLQDLRDGALQVLFSVDLFNEGVDLPEVDVLLLLRPTESATLFLQQLGRGLRKAAGKSACTVLDFVGQHRREFRFDRKLRGLLGGTRRRLVQQVEQGFPFLPAGCHMQLDDVAQERVLRSLRDALPSLWKEKARELAAMVQDAGDVRLAGFLDGSGLELEDIYPAGTGDRGWSALRDAAGLPVAAPGPAEDAFRRACGRMLHVDDAERIGTWREWLQRRDAPHAAALPKRQRRLLRMLVASVMDKSIAKGTTLQEGADLLWQHPQVRGELDELFEVLEARIDHVHHALAGSEDVPLAIHGRYSRVEMMAAFDAGGDTARIAPFQPGVLAVEPCRTELLAFTLDKSSGSFSPTTRYRDYAISPSLIHWESQRVVREASAKGQRYQHHEALGWRMMLFARLRQDERAFWFLGPGTYVSHESERPMQVTWRLDVPLPGDLFEAFAAAVA